MAIIRSKRLLIGLLVLLAVGIILGAKLRRPALHPNPADTWPPSAEYLAARPAKSAGWIETSEYVRMRDGVRIAVTVMKASATVPGHAAPAVLRVARYWRRSDIAWPASSLMRDPMDPGLVLLDHGYVLVNVDIRGTGASFGVWQLLPATTLGPLRQSGWPWLSR